MAVNFKIFVEDKATKLFRDTARRIKDLQAPKNVGVKTEVDPIKLKRFRKKWL